MSEAYNQKGVSLIIVIFAMVLFAGLVWTLVSMYSGEFESNMRTFESEKALYLAESGGQWGTEKWTSDNTWRTSSDTACDQSGEWVLHETTYGQYRVCCRDPNTGAGETGGAIIESEGYVPSYANYLAKRKIKLCMNKGGLGRAVQVRYLLNWSGASSYSPLILGDVGVKNVYSDNLHDGYEGDNALPHNQATDVDPEEDSLKPPGSGEREFLGDDSSFPMINMYKIETEYAEDIWNPARSGGLSTLETVGANSELTFDTEIFGGEAVGLSQFVGQALRNTTMGSWQSGSWAIIGSVSSTSVCQVNGTVNWTDATYDSNERGDRVCLVPKIATCSVVGTWTSGNPKYTYEITFACNVPFTEGNVLRNFTSEGRNSTQNKWDYRDWGEITSVSTTASSTTIRVQLDSSVATPPGWLADDWVGEVKRFSGNNNNALWFLRGDMLYDLRGGNIANCETSFFTAEGDIGLIGSATLRIKAHVTTSDNATLPNIASKNGSIYSYSGLTSGSRVFQGVAYSYNGDLTFDSLNGTSVFGNNVTFSGYLNLNYINWSNYVGEDGFLAFGSSATWSEEE